jgi:Ca2+-binding RTX toxin-like protein
VTAYTFETITAAQASAYDGASDSLQFQSPTAHGGGATVSFGASSQVSILVEGRTVTFGAGVLGDLDIRFSDGGMLFAGSAGADAVNGQDQGDALFGGTGDDVLNGGLGDDLLQGNQGADNLSGGAGSDSVYGGQGDDLISLAAAASSAAETNWTNGNRGADTISGGAGADTMLGGQDNDQVSGGSGADFVDGNLGADTLSGDGDNDTVLGEDGDDVIDGGAGFDVLTGGAGADTFVFAAGSSGAGPGQGDVVTDWSASDRIDSPIAGTALNYLEDSGATTAMGGGGYGYSSMPVAMDFNSAFTAANNSMAMNPALDIVAEQVNADVIVFIDSDGDNRADLSIVLANTNLSSIDASNFV